LTASLTKTGGQSFFIAAFLQHVRNISPFRPDYRQLSEHKKSSQPVSASQCVRLFGPPQVFFLKSQVLPFSTLKYFSSGKGYFRPVIETDAIN
jgi:hypothetical protein